MDWFRFYSEAMHDIKIKRIVRSLKTDLNHVVGAWCVLLCLANDSPIRGKLLINTTTPMTVEDIAEVMGIEVDFAQRWINEFIAAGMLMLSDDTIYINNWNKRQFVSDNSTERVRKFRDKPVKRFGNVTVTPMKQNETPPDTDADSDTELPPKSPTGGAVDDVSLIAFENRYNSLQPGTCSGLVKDRLKSYLDKYGAEELDTVFDAAADMKATGSLSNPLRYIGSVLEKRRKERESQPQQMTDEEREDAYLRRQYEANKRLGICGEEDAA